VLRLDEKDERDDEERRRPKIGGTVLDGLCAGIDRSKYRGVADAREHGHEDEARQRAMHLASNQPEEGHGAITRASVQPETGMWNWSWP
jgi:hypothetical protein